MNWYVCMNLSKILLFGLLCALTTSSSAYNFTRKTPTFPAFVAQDAATPTTILILFKTLKGSMCEEKTRLALMYDTKKSRTVHYGCWTESVGKVAVDWKSMRDPNSWKLSQDGQYATMQCELFTIRCYQE